MVVGSSPVVETVIVQDRSRLFREGLSALLGSRPSCAPAVGQLEAVDQNLTATTIRVELVMTAKELLERCEQVSPDAAFIELAEVPWDVGELVRRLKRQAPEIRLVGTLPSRTHRFTAFPGVEPVLKDVAFEEMMSVLESTSPGSRQVRDGTAADSNGVARVGQVQQVQQSHSMPGGLTGRELQLLALISAGMSTSEMSARLKSSSKTLENRRQSLFAKLGVQSQSQAVAAALRTGILGPTSRPMATDNRSTSAGDRRTGGASGSDGSKAGLAYMRPALLVHRTRPGIPKVVVAHDHAYVPAVIRHIMGERVELVGETKYGAAAVALSELLGPDVVVAAEMLGDGLVDLFLPALMRAGSKVVVVADELDAARMLTLVRKGASGIVETDASPDDVCESVEALARGEVRLPAGVVASITKEWRAQGRRALSNSSAGGASRSTNDLTPRESDVLRAMAEGLSTKAVARKLGIALKTVENHKTRVFEKLGVRTQAEAVAVAFDELLTSAAAPSAAAAPVDVARGATG